MDSVSPSEESIVRMSEDVLRTFNNLNGFAKSAGTTISGIYAYIAIGSLNIQNLGNHHYIYTPVLPSMAAKYLNYNNKKMLRLIHALTERGLLVREFGGAYKVADFSAWMEAAKLIGVNVPNGIVSSSNQSTEVSFQSANRVEITSFVSRHQMRDRL